MSYYALTAGSVHKHESPERIAKGLANHPVGVVLLCSVMVHAIDDAARKFYEYFNFDPSPIDPFQLMLLLKDVRKALR